MHVDRWLAPLLLFAVIYVAASVGLSFVAHVGRFEYGQWVSLASAIIATTATIRLFDHGHFPIGLATRPANAIREFAFGALFAAVLILASDALIALAAHLRHTRGNGFPWDEVFLVYVPAAVHEELLFRGYPYQKARQSSRTLAIIGSSLVFALLHMGNRGLTAIAFANLVIAGVLLALAYERYERLWFPIGLHLAWNLVSGPLIGYPVSGFVSNPTVFITHVTGPPAITGGDFGIEGSLAITLVETAACLILLRGMIRRPIRSTPPEEPA